MEEILYVLCPGYIAVTQDGQCHWVGVQELIQGYKLPEDASWTVYDPNAQYTSNARYLYPRKDGKYEPVTQ